MVTHIFSEIDSAEVYLVAMGEDNTGVFDVYRVAMGIKITEVLRCGLHSI